MSIKMIVNVVVVCDVGTSKQQPLEALAQHYKMKRVISETEFDNELTKDLAGNLIYTEDLQWLADADVFSHAGYKIISVGEALKEAGL